MTSDILPNFYFLIFSLMFGFTAADATSILGQITTNGSGIVTTLVSLAGVLLAVAAFRWVFKLVRGALHF